MRVLSPALIYSSNANTEKDKFSHRQLPLRNSAQCFLKPSSLEKHRTFEFPFVIFLLNKKNQKSFRLKKQF